MTKLSKSPVSIAKSNKQLFGYEQAVKRIANIRFTRKIIEKKPVVLCYNRSENERRTERKRPLCPFFVLEKPSGQKRAAAEWKGILFINPKDGEKDGLHNCNCR